MFQSIWDEVKREFQYGNMVSRIIIVNLAVFICIILAKLFLNIPGTVSHFHDFLNFFTISADPHTVLTHPWTLITAAFTHEGIGHIFWNMLVFFWFGRIVGDLLGNHRVLPLYLLGAIAGNIVFLLAANYSPYITGSYALGASAAVMSMVACSAFIAPDYIFNIIFLGPVKLKFVALTIIILDIAAVANNSNAGGNLAHLGGVAMGMYFAWSLQTRGFDLSKPLNNAFNYFQLLFNPAKRKAGKIQEQKSRFKKFEKSRIDPREFDTQMRGEKNNKVVDDSKTKPKTKSKQLSEQERLDKILEKIKDSSYESLSPEEKTFLENMSKKS